MMFAMTVAAVAAILATAPAGQVRADDGEAMRLAAGQLVGSQLPTGLFRYNFNFLTGEGTDPKNSTSPNLVRQAGTAYILAEHHLRAPDARLRRTLETALEGFGTLSLPITRTAIQHAIQKTRILSLRFGRRTIQKTLNRLGLLYSPAGDGRVISPDGTYESAWLGGTALALAAELRYFRATGDDRFAELRKAWLRGLLGLRLPGGGFRAAPHYTGEEHYFNGEGWLALAIYADTFPGDRDANEVLRRLDEYLLGRYSGNWNMMFYSWGTMAAEIRHRITRDKKFRHFIATQAGRFLDRLKDKTKDDSRLNCAQLEGLGAALRALGGTSGSRYQDLVRRLRERTGPAMAENRKLQIRPGQDRIALADGAYLWSAQLGKYVGAFLGGPTDPMTQIDHTGHCLSAMMILDGSTRSQ